MRVVRRERAGQYLVVSWQSHISSPYLRSSTLITVVAVRCSWRATSTAIMLAVGANIAASWSATQSLTDDAPPNTTAPQSRR